MKFVSIGEAEEGEKKKKERKKKKKKQVMMDDEEVVPLFYCILHVVRVIMPLHDI